MPLTSEALAALRAQLAFLRDMGIYDLYRRAGPGIALQEAASVKPETSALDALPAQEASPPVVERAPLFAAQKEIRSAEAVPALAAQSAGAVRKRSAQPLPPPLTMPGEPLAPDQKPAALQAIREHIGDCTRCPLAFQGRHTIVFGDGDPSAQLLFVGEGPGADEDASGLPFVGKAGQLLNNMITAMGLKREEVYIANIVKCRPPGNRTPEPEEAATCTPFLLDQIGVVRPRVIVALGSTAATWLLGARSPLSALRGRIHPAYGAKVIVTYHPAYLLRDPRQKKEAWADLQMAMRELG